MSNQLIYSYEKKYAVSSSYFSAPWVKQGSGSFNSKVSRQIIRKNRRESSRRFFNSRDLFFKKTIAFFYLRYNEDFQAVTDYQADKLAADFSRLLSMSFKSKVLVNKRLTSLVRLLLVFNPHMSDYNFVILKRLLMIYYNLRNGPSTCKHDLLEPYAVRAENSGSFLPLRDSWGTSDFSRAFTRLI